MFLVTVGGKCFIQTIVLVITLLQKGCTVVTIHHNMMSISPFGYKAVGHHNIVWNLLGNTKSDVFTDKYFISCMMNNIVSINSSPCRHTLSLRTALN
jgi:predicted nucleic acid-binding Zn finger protein